MKEDKNLAIGVFDSGMGGISVLAQIIKQMPNEKFIYYGDSLNAPYGVKTPEEVKKLSKNICDFLIKEGVKTIVVACNTATSAAIKEIRDIYDIPIIGMEPALKPAVELNPKGKIIVMATEMTLKEKKFAKLMERYGKEADIVKIPCPKLVELVEDGVLEGKVMEETIRNCLGDIKYEEISSIVLGCTHFVFLRDSIRNIVGDKVKIIDGNEGTARHLQNILQGSDMLNTDKREEVDITIYNSKEDKEIIDLSKKLLQFSLKKLEY